MPGHAKTPGYDGPEGTEWGDQYAPGKAEWVDDGRYAVRQGEGVLAQRWFVLDTTTNAPAVPELYSTPEAAQAALKRLELNR